MPQFTFTGSEEMVFPSLAAADGSTLVCKPGDVVTLDVDPQVEGLSPVAAPAPAPAPEPVPAPAPVEAPQTAPEAPTAPPATN